MPDQPLQAGSPMRDLPSTVEWARASRRIAVVSCALLLAACASSDNRRSQPRPGAAPAWEVESPGLSPPADLASVPDAEPTVEAMRGGPMRPYNACATRCSWCR